MNSTPNTFLLLLVLRRCLPLRRPPHSLGPVLALFACSHPPRISTIPSQHQPISHTLNAKEMHVRTLLSARLLDLRSSPIPHQPIMRLKLLHHLMAIIDERETGALATSVLGSEAEAGDLVFVGFVELGELLTEFVFGDVGAVGMKDISGMAEAH